VKDHGRRTKIIATLGPASCTDSVIRELVCAGVDIFRFNFSHGNYEFHQKNASIIRRLEREGGKTVAIMVDLQGPKIRIGAFKDGQILLHQGHKFVFDLENNLGTIERITLPHPEIFTSISAGTDMLLDDGKIRVRVVNSDECAIETEVIVGGKLSDRKGVNIPGALLPISSLTDKDLRDIEWIDGMTADYVAISFVQQATDIAHAKRLLNDNIKVVAKIEKPKAVENLDDIIAEADVVMVARGDLGVELPIETIPCVQRQIISRCKRYGKPVIVATQMMESMIQNPVPTRAEVSDVSTAVWQKADIVMLSAETASGKYPIEVVRTMDRIIRYSEQNEQ
jgi:pyruvate kinase